MECKRAVRCCVACPRPMCRHDVAGGNFVVGEGLLGPFFQITKNFCRDSHQTSNANPIFVPRHEKCEPQKTLLSRVAERAVVACTAFLPGLTANVRKAYHAIPLQMRKLQSVHCRKRGRQRTFVRCRLFHPTAFVPRGRLRISTVARGDCRCKRGRTRLGSILGSRPQ
jgi:hypothetical protein